MSEPVRWGILSTAKINDAILGGAREAAGAEVVAVASRDRARAEAYAAERGIPGAHGSYEALMEAFMWRYHPATDELARLVRGGAVGRLRVVRAAFAFSLPAEAENVRWSRELEGGALMDVGCYCLSALRLLAGEPERVAAERVDGADGVDARLAGLLRFPGDVLGTFDCAFDVPPRAGIEVVGETGTIVSLDPWRGQASELRVLRAGSEPEEVPAEPANPYALELEDFSRAVRGGPPPRLGREDAVGQARAIEALYRSATEGRSVAP